METNVGSSHRGKHDKNHIKDKKVFYFPRLKNALEQNNKKRNFHRHNH